MKEIKRGLAFAALMLGAAYSLSLAKSFGVIADESAGHRAAMALLGLYFAATGNAMPKQLTPLASLTCSGARIQAFQRFAGWTWVLTGLGFSLVWLTVPGHYTKPASMMVLSGGMLAVIVRLGALMWRRTPRPA